MPLGTQRCTWRVLMDRTQWSASWSIMVLMSVSQITRASHLSTLLLRPPMVPCVWSSWSTVELMSMFRYVQFVLNIDRQSKFCVLYANTNFVMFPQSRDGKSPLHLTAVHGRFTRSQTLIQNGKAVFRRLKDHLHRMRFCGKNARHRSSWAIKHVRLPCVYIRNGKNVFSVYDS